MIGVPEMSITEDKKWKAESDARALVEAETIRADAKRLAPAKRELKKQAKVIINL